jgi:hypothetical protein
MTSRHFTKYIVLNVEAVLTSARPSAKTGKVRGSKGGGARGRGRRSFCTHVIFLSLSFFCVVRIFFFLFLVLSLFFLKIDFMIHVL